MPAARCSSVDGAQAIGAIPVDVGALGADFYAMPAQKWLLGPEGMAALHVGSGVLGARAPDVRRVLLVCVARPGRRRPSSGPTPDDSRRPGTAAPSVVGMARSIAWLSMYVGLDWVHGRGATLARRRRTDSRRSPGVELVTPREQMATLVTFRIAGWPTADAFEEIARRSFAIFRTLPIDALRISVGFYNTEAELDRFASIVELVASHTPATLPPRRTLTILGEDG